MGAWWATVTLSWWLGGVCLAGGDAGVLHGGTTLLQTPALPAPLLAACTTQARTFSENDGVVSART